ncbi:DUF4262 domain-containing protein [Streptomyces hundungensis]|uniref:DUF4262 domain-containing protein n=1 Tax=Streptomyces hundungensis TaxID=1077946 RepID=UPI003D18531F
MTGDPFECRCVLCHDYGDRGEADQMDLTINSNVQQHGWHVVMVPEDGVGPGFAYTIGLAHTHGGPELAMFGLDIHAMHRMSTSSATGLPPAASWRTAKNITTLWTAIQSLSRVRTSVGTEPSSGGPSSSTGSPRCPSYKLHGPMRKGVSLGKSRRTRSTASPSHNYGCRPLTTRPGSGPQNSARRSVHVRTLPGSHSPFAARPRELAAALLP